MVVIAIVLFLIALSLTTGINIFEDVMFLFWIIVPVLIGLILIKKAIENHNFLKKIENTATSKIRSVAIGLVEIKGKTVLKEELISPINEKRCIGYNVRYSVKSKTPLPIGYSVQKYSGKDYKTNDFYLEDETGRILVKAKGEKITLEYKQHVNISFYNTITDSNGIEDKIPVIEITEDKILFANKEQKKEIIERMKSMPKLFGEITPETKKELLTLENFSKKYKPVLNEIQIIEDYVGEGKEVYVLGNVELDENGNKVIVRGKDNLFEISENSEMKVMKIFKYRSIIYGIIGTCALIFAIGLLTGTINLVESGSHSWSIKIQLIGMLL